MPQPHDPEIADIAALIEKGEWSAALDASCARLDENPFCLTTLRHALTCAWCLGRRDLAISLADKVLEISPFESSVLTTKGLLCLVNGDLEMAESALSTAIGFAETPTQKELAQKTLNLTRELLKARRGESGLALVEVEESPNAAAIEPSDSYLKSA